MSDKKQKSAQSISKNLQVKLSSVLSSRLLLLHYANLCLLIPRWELCWCHKTAKKNPLWKIHVCTYKNALFVKKVGGEIHNRAWDLHRDEIRVKQNLQRPTSHKQMQGLGVYRIPFKVRYNLPYNKVASYFLDIMMPVNCVQGNLISLTNVSKGAYYALNNHVVAYVKNFHFIPENKYKQF